MSSTGAGVAFGPMPVDALAATTAVWTSSLPSSPSVSSSSSIDSAMAAATIRASSSASISPSNGVPSRAGASLCSRTRSVATDGWLKRNAVTP